DDINMDMEEVMSDTSNIVADFTSVSVEPGGSAMPLGNARVNGLPRLTLSSTDSHLISVLRQVKLGGYSDVYQGLYAPTQLRLAMKCPRIIEGTPEAIAVKRRWMREAKMWLSLNHVNILPFYGVAELSSITYLVAPWVAHGYLSKFLADRLEYLARSPFAQGSGSDQRHAAFEAFDEATIIHGIASGLAYLHACDMIHGDIKAVNILLADSLTPLLGDFGLTKYDEVDATSPGLKGSGTARWKSPGLTNHESRTVKTDIYALGMTIVEVLTGREPFPHLRHEYIVYKEVSKGHRPPFEPISRKGKDFIPLWEIAASSWEKEPENRPTAAKVVSCAAHLLSLTPQRKIKIHSCVASDDCVQDIAFDSPDRRTSDASELLSVAILHHTENRQELALSVLQVVYQQSRRSHDRKGMAKCLMCNGEVLRELKYHGDALTSFHEAYVIYRELSDRGMMAYCLKSIGVTKRGQGYHGDALTSSHEACVIYRELGNRSMMALCLESIGVTKVEQGHYSNALTPLCEAYTIYRELDDRTMMASCLNSIGVAKREQGHHDNALISLHEAYTISRELGNRSMMVLCLESIEMTKGKQGHYDSALTSLCEAYVIYKALNNQSMMAYCLESIGATKRQQGYHSDALTSSREAYAIYKELDDRTMMASCLNSIGVTKREQGHHGDALTSLHEAHVIYRELDNQSMMALCLESIGMTKGEQGNYSSALTSLCEACTIYKALNDRSMIAHCLESIGATKRQQGHHGDAITSLHEAYVIYRELDNRTKMAYCLGSIGATKREQGHHGDALISLHEAYVIYKELNDRIMMAFCLKSIGVTKRGQSAAAKH
ncbi:hypothetical protein FRB95_000962, partial [Tulasnella sp. JGI-2019a]